MVFPEGWMKNSREKPVAKGTDANELSYGKLHLILNVLEANGHTKTLECLRHEVAPTHAFGSNVLEDVVPVEQLITDESVEHVNTRWKKKLEEHPGNTDHLKDASESVKAYEKRMQALQKQMADIRELVDQGERPSLEEQLEEIKNHKGEIENLEANVDRLEKSESQLRVDFGKVSQEVGDLRRTLEDRVDAETKLKIKLAKVKEELMRVQQELNAPPVRTPARVIMELLQTWAHPDAAVRALIAELFLSVDGDKDGHLQWNNDEIRGFVRLLFAKLGLPLPTWQDHVWYEMYRRADVNGSYSVELEEASRFARHCFEAALALYLVPEIGQTRDSFSSIEQWARSHAGVSMAKTVITYSSGVNIDLVDFARTWHGTVLRNQTHRNRMIRSLETGDHIRQTLQTYKECDRDFNGRLEWNNGEIREFIQASFRQHGLVPPQEEQIYALFLKFDRDRNDALDTKECMEMVDALFRSTFIVDNQGAPLKGRGSNKQVGTTGPAVRQMAGRSFSVKGSVLQRNPASASITLPIQAATMSRTDSALQPRAAVVRAASPERAYVRAASPERAYVARPPSPLTGSLTNVAVATLAPGLNQPTSPGRAAVTLPFTGSRTTSPSTAAVRVISPSMRSASPSQQRVVFDGGLGSGIAGSGLARAPSYTGSPRVYSPHLSPRVVTASEVAAASAGALSMSQVAPRARSVSPGNLTLDMPTVVRQSSLQALPQVAWAQPGSGRLPVGTSANAKPTTTSPPLSVVAGP